MSEQFKPLATQSAQKAVLFDLDGTLVNSLGDICASVNHMLLSRGYRERSIQEIRQFVGSGAKVLLRRALPENVKMDEAEFDRFYKEYRAYYLEHSTDTTRPYNGVPELLSELARRGYALAVVTNKPDPHTKLIVNRFFSDWVSSAAGLTDELRRKPAPDLVFKALSELEIDVSHAVYVGDSEVDIATAKAAGVPCVSVLWGFRTKEQLVNGGAEIIAETPDNVLDAVMRLEI